MGEINMSSTDRKASNGKGTQRIDSGGDLSTTVQMGKATANYSKLISGQFTTKTQMSDTFLADKAEKYRGGGEKLS